MPCDVRRASHSVALHRAGLTAPPSMGNNREWKMGREQLPTLQAADGDGQGVVAGIHLVVQQPLHLPPKHQHQLAPPLLVCTCAAVAAAACAAITAARAAAAITAAAHLAAPRCCCALRQQRRHLGRSQQLGHAPACIGTACSRKANELTLCMLNLNHTRIPFHRPSASLLDVLGSEPPNRRRQQLTCHPSCACHREGGVLQRLLQRLVLLRLPQQELRALAGVAPAARQVVAPRLPRGAGAAAAG